MTLGDDGADDKPDAMRLLAYSCLALRMLCETAAAWTLDTHQSVHQGMALKMASASAAPKTRTLQWAARLTQPHASSAPQTCGLTKRQKVGNATCQQQQQQQPQHSSSAQSNGALCLCLAHNFSSWHSHPAICVCVATPVCPRTRLPLPAWHPPCPRCITAGRFCAGQLQALPGPPGVHAA